MSEIPEEEFKARLVKLKFEKMIVKYLGGTIIIEKKKNREYKVYPRKGFKCLLDAKDGLSLQRMRMTKLKQLD